MILKQWLASKAMTQAEFAELVGTSQSRVSKWILGGDVPHRTMMCTINDATDGQVTPNDWILIPA